MAEARARPISVPCESAWVSKFDLFDPNNFKPWHGLTFSLAFSHKIFFPFTYDAKKQNTRKYTHVQLLSEMYLISKLVRTWNLVQAQLGISERKKKNWSRPPFPVQKIFGNKFSSRGSFDVSKIKAWVSVANGAARSREPLSWAVILGEPRR